MSRNVEMTAYIFIITFCMIAKVYSSFDFKVYQPQSVAVNPDGSAIITCEHDANVSSIQDVQLFAIPPSDKSKKIPVCQKGQKDCKNIIMHLENSNKCFFIMLNVGAEAMNMEYECKFVVIHGDIDFTRKGNRTRLRPCTETVSHYEHTLPQSPTCPQSNLLITWILAGLLALTFMYSCVISAVCIIQRRKTAEPEHATYVEMRKAPLLRNPATGICYG
ncbi:uncharacterized protein LOC115411902 [Sphaeramia orbicularis]|uniref:uncharacterized protein LOC115411902 n=1 Tax=Sphaeramia orbicularis TaxID=375764 RepID=UPI00117D4DA5|nr:uncharacterized protein LOC115411902 [Sphaeramia orbicularis]